jgi:hypothetical protein
MKQKKLTSSRERREPGPRWSRSKCSEPCGENRFLEREVVALKFGPCILFPKLARTFSNAHARVILVKDVSSGHMI